MADPGDSQTYLHCILRLDPARPADHQAARRRREAEVEAPVSNMRQGEIQRRRAAGPVLPARKEPRSSSLQAVPPRWPQPRGDQEEGSPRRRGPSSRWRGRSSGG